MSHYNPEIHHRRSIRLKGYDYASEGLYFVTICTQNRECLFGEIKNDEMMLNDAGRMVEKWYLKTQDKVPDIVCHEMVIMPNHFHCIWENVGLHGASAVGADLRVRPVENNDGHINEGTHIGNGNTRMILEGAHIGNENTQLILEGAHIGAPLRDPVLDKTELGTHTGSPLSMVVRWFKTMSTNEYIRGVNELGWTPFERKLWQRNYYEHIIRDDASLLNIAYYIENNAANWQDDDFYPKN